MTTTQSRIRFLGQTYGLVFLFALLTITASAQSNKGTIKGTIKDQNGALVQNATVTIVNVATKEERTVKTGDDGTYDAPLLDPGTYRITVKAASFPDTIQENVIVQTSSTAVVDIALTPGAGTNEVTVTSAPSQIKEQSKGR